MKKLEIYDIVLMSDGYEIIKLYLNEEMNTNLNKIKLIITDENMDYLNGSEVIKFIRSYEKSKNNLNPMLLASLSGNEDSQMEHYLLKCGANFTFKKPFCKGFFRKIFEKLEPSEKKKNE